MVLATISFHCRFFQKAGDGFGKNEGFQKAKEMVLGTNYWRKTNRRLKTKTMQKTPTGLRVNPDRVYRTVLPSHTDTIFNNLNKLSSCQHIYRLQME
jgi:hypothetical protein